MKSNYVVVVEKDTKYYAQDISVYENSNLLYAFKQFEFDGRKLHIIHWCRTAKKARALATEWNLSYKINGTLMDL